MAMIHFSYVGAKNQTNYFFVFWFGINLNDDVRTDDERGLFL